LQEDAGVLGYAQLKGAPDRELKHSSTVNLLRNAIEILSVVRFAEQAGPQAKKARALLRLLYGVEDDGATPDGLRQLFFAILKLSLAQEQEEGTEHSVDPTEFNRQAIDKEMLRLVNLIGIASTIDSQKREGELATRRVPAQEISDHLIRREVHLSREIDRILSRLERLQRMRKGQPPPPRLDVNFS
jgi:hypothetical protein